MPRIRSLKPEFFKDEDLATLPIATRYFFEGLWCCADKAGRLEDRPRYLKVEIFPYDDVDVESMLQQLAQPNVQDRPKKQFIKRYEVEGKRYIQILEFNKHQAPHHTEKESTIPQLHGELTVPLACANSNSRDCAESLYESLYNKHTAHGEHSNGESTVNQSKNFDAFWAAYPKRKNRGRAEKAFKKLKPDDGLMEEIIKAINQAKKSPQWVKDNGQFIPYPETWLNAKGWLDEYEVPKESW